MAAKRTTQSDSPEKKPRRAPRTPRWLKEGERLAKILSERNIGQTELAQRIGRKFHNVHRWTRGFEFGPENQTLVARELELPTDIFEAPNASKKRERETRAALERFLETKPIAQSLTPEEWQVLRSIRFPDEGLQASAAFFESVAFALKGAIRVDEIMSVAEENAALDDELAHKSPPRRR